MLNTSQSNTMILDLVTRFLNRLLENDSKASTYLKQWDSFRPLLSAAPLELSHAYSYINNMILPTSDSFTSVQSKPSGIGIQVLPPKEQYSFNILSGLELNGSFEAHSTRSLGEEKNKRRHSLFDTKNQLAPHSTDLRRVTSSHKPSQFSHRSFQQVDSPDAFGGNFATKDLLSDITHEDSIEYGHSFGSPTYTLKEMLGSGVHSHNLNLLTELAKKMKEKVSIHTDKLLMGMNNKKQMGMLLEERSPLRRLRVYGITEDNGSYQGGQAGQYVRQELGTDYLQKLRYY